MADVVAAVAVRDDLAGAVVGDADAALQAYDAAIARTTSVAWRADPEGFRERRAATSASALDRLRSRVTLLAPADGTYSLGSSDAPLVLTVRNDLPVAVEVLLESAPAAPAGCRSPTSASRRWPPGSARRCRCRPRCASPAASR